MAPAQTSRAASAARKSVLDQLKDDHKRVKKAYKEFEKLNEEQGPEACEEIVGHVLDELSVHAAIEEEFLYPAARGEIEDDLIDEAEIEHESMHQAIDRLRGMSPADEKYAARFTVLCEYVLHHVKEEEGEIFPQLEKANIEWETLAQEMNERRESLMQDTGSTAEVEDRSENVRAGRRSAGDSARSAQARHRS